MDIQLIWNEYFQPTKKRERIQHSTRISPTNIPDLNDKDNKQFQRIVEQCFGLHISYKPKKFLMKDIDFIQNEAIAFFDENDIKNIFITEYYDYPGMDCLDPDDTEKVVEQIPVKETFHELVSQLSGKNEIAVLMGNVGEGKSAFLSKFALDLKYAENLGKTYLPITINVQHYENILDQGNPQEAVSEFLEKVCREIVNFLEKEKGHFIATETKRSRQEKSQVSLSGSSSLSAIIAKLKLMISTESSVTEEYVSSRQLDIFEQINEAAQRLDELNYRMIIIFDNLDTLCYKEERFMFFPDGYALLTTKIDIVKSIISNVLNVLRDSGCSFIFAIRPYVYTHVFQGEVQEILQNHAKYVFKISEIDPYLPIMQRLAMLKHLLNKIENSKHVFEGKKAALKKNIHKFQEIVSKAQKYQDKPFIKLYNISNQGFRSMVKFYQMLKYHDKLFLRYFSHDIVYLYILSMRQLYSQVPPNNGKKLLHVSYFPNIFLIKCNNYINNKYPDAAAPHGPIYWLKFMILTVAISEERISVAKLKSIFSDYEDQAVRLCLGSLATVNDSNCLHLNFSEEHDNLHNLMETTFVKPTKRGAYLVDQFYCLGLECLQLYFDDWLLPIPVIDETELPEEIFSLLQNNSSSNYDYLLNGDSTEYTKARISLINKKAKQALLMIYILKHSLSYEMKRYPVSWKNLSEYIDNDIFNDTFFNEMIDRIINDSSDSMGKDAAFKLEMEEFNDSLKKYSGVYDDFFEKILQARGVLV